MKAYQVGIKSDIGMNQFHEKQYYFCPSLAKLKSEEMARAWNSGLLNIYYIPSPIEIEIK